jgi:hypothetical protein
MITETMIGGLTNADTAQTRAKNVTWYCDHCAAMQVIVIRGGVRRCRSCEHPLEFHDGWVGTAADDTRKPKKAKLTTTVARVTTDDDEVEETLEERPRDLMDLLAELDDASPSAPPQPSEPQYEPQYEP